MRPTLIQPEIVSRVIVKPSSPTPNHPEIHNLSFFDQRAPNFYGPLLYLYAQGTSDHDNIIAHKSTLLRTSLSTLISHYYPLAGRLRADGISFDCNDEGVVFVEARIELRLSEFLENPREGAIELLFPDGLHHKDPNLSTPLVVQLTFFKCGGMAIAICISHKLMDMGCMCSFASDWATMSRDSGKEISVDFLRLGTLYSPPNLRPRLPDYVAEEIISIVTRRIVFSRFKLEKLKAMVGEATKVELVTALICKAAMSASRASSGIMKRTALLQLINMRKRVGPLVTEKNAGNFTGSYFVRSSEEDSNKIDLKWLVGELRQRKLEYLAYFNSAPTREEVCLRCLEDTKKNLEAIDPMNSNMYVFSSWCRFPYYEANFGWGKPAWVTSPGYVAKNHIWMMDTRDGDGIEAIVTLEEGEMALFERDQQILAFATTNPTRLPNRSKL